MTNIEYNKIEQDTSSFQLVRTNPKLTSNVKLTVDITGNMWLDSIEVSSELADSKYKKFTVNPKISHPANIFNFYENGKTPNEIAFSLTENVSKVKTSTDYKDQYDFSEYFSGARYLPSKQYNERLSYFAPLYLKQGLPDSFVILKIEDPLNYKIDESKNKYPFNKEDYIIDMFKKSTIIKTFDLSENSKVGTYLRKYIEDPAFPKAGITADFEKDAFTKYNGILLDSGAFGSRSELLDDFYSDSSPLKHFEQYISNGFERNGVIFPNIMNIEFIFNDETSDLYDFNRYVGFYINRVELDKLTTDIERVYDERATWQNTPRLRKSVKEYEDIPVFQENPDGVLFPYSNSDLTMSEFDNTFLDKDSLYMNYINDRNGNMYSFKLSDEPIIEDLDPNLVELDSGKIRLSKKEINLGDFFGPGRDLIQDSAFSTNIAGSSNSYLKILSELSHLDSIKFYHPSGTRLDTNGKYDLLTATVGYTQVPDPGDFYFYNDIDNILGSDEFYFNATGTPIEIAQAIEGCLNNIRNRSFRITRIDEYVFIKASSSGDYDDRYALEFESILLDYSTIQISMVTGDDLISNQIQFEGGSSYRGNRIIMDAGQKQKLLANLDSALVKTQRGWSKIKKVSNYIDTINSGYRDYFDKIAVVLELEQEPFISFGEAIIKLIHRPSFGFISFLPIRDFDFDFYSSKYLNFPINDLYKFYFLPADIPILRPGETYEVYGTGIIEFDGTEYVEGLTFTIPAGTYASYSIVSGNPVVSYQDIDFTNASGSTIIPYNDENNEIKDFEGFFLLKDPATVVGENTSEAFNRRSRYLNGIAQTEYDFYKENSNTDFALESKILPYITKWALLNGKDARSNPYRLNTELPFGFNNFSPSHDDTSQNPSNFTHEWFYLESRFEYIESAETAKLNNSYFETPLDENQLLTERDYFLDYFTYTPTFGTDEVGETQTRYAIISKNQVKEFQAFLKGFKVNFNDVINPDDIGADGKPVANPNTTRFENYKFSCLLRPIKEDINDPTQPPIKYRVIEHKDFKFILILIEVQLGAISEVDTLWKDLTYQTPHRGVNRSNFRATDPNVTNLLYDSIDGDYRIGFETDITTGIDISNLTHSLLYSLKHKKFNNLLDNYSNIKLSSKVDLSTSGITLGSSPGDPDIISRLDNPSIPNYPSTLADEIVVSTDSTFLMPRFISASLNYFMDTVSGTTPQNTNPIVNVSNNDIFVPDVTNAILIDENNVYSSNIPTGFPQSLYANNYVFKSMVSGERYYEKIIERLSFARFKEYTNELNNFIEYESYELDSSGTPVPLASPNFYIDIPDNEAITKIQGLAPLNDDNKPSNFSFIDVIGYKYYRSQLDNSYEINRYKGNYEPIFTDVLFFNSKYSFTSNPTLEDIKLANIKFNIDIDNFTTIQNFNHIKIAATKILDLEANESFEPRYEKINEIAIGKQPYFLFGSNWEYGFHHNYLDKASSSPVAGTLRIEEDDSFIGKLITLPDGISLDNFNVTELGELELLENVNLDKIEIVSKETSTGLSGYININNILTRYLIENGLIDKFNEYLLNEEQYIGSLESIEEYTKEYIRLNILKLYETSSLEFYTKKDRELVSNLQTPVNSNNIQIVSLTAAQRSQQGFSIDKNLEINKYERLILRFNFKKNVVSGTLVSPEIKIKFI